MKKTEAPKEPEVTPIEDLIPNKPEVDKGAKKVSDGSKAGPKETDEPADITTLAQLRDEHLKRGTSPSTEEIAAVEKLEKETNEKLSQIARGPAGGKGGR